MRQHQHLTPSAGVTQDPELVAAVAHAEALAETQSPRAAVAAALKAAGVDDLEERYEALLAERDALQQRLDAALAALAPPAATPLAEACATASFAHMGARR